MTGMNAVPLVDKPRLELGFAGCKPAGLPLTYKPMAEQWTAGESNSDPSRARGMHARCASRPWWSHGDLNPRFSDCQSDVLPLDDGPM